FDNLTLTFTANHTITGAATLNLNTIGAKSIKRFNGSDLTAGDIVSGLPVSVIYKLGTDTWYMVSAAAALFANMHADFNENASPGDPAANVARLYARDDGSGNTELAWRDSAGVISVLKQATAANMEAAAADRLVAASLQHRHPGHPKAWGRFAVNGTLVSGDYNVASVVRDSAGVYTVTLTNAMADTNYSVLVTSPDDGVNAWGLPTVQISSASVFVIRTKNLSGVAADGGGAHFAVFGDMS
ncbi:MAG TPA: hypothetical protein VL017_05405, partial [Devosia sp.]|nr:hypothetical protein [Devosia sp.]